MYVLIPTYNEEKNIEKLLELLGKSKLKPIFVDDGSTDKTYELLKKAGVLVLRHPRNKGKAEAIRTGLNFLVRKFEPEQVVLMDADLAYDPSQAFKLLKPLEKNQADLVIGCRKFSKTPFRNRLGNWVWRTCFNFLLGTKFRDTNCGFVALSRKAIEALKNKLRGGYFLENLMLIEALKKGLRIEQVEVDVSYKKLVGFSKGVRIVLSVLFSILLEGLKYRLKI